MTAMDEADQNSSRQHVSGIISGVHRLSRRSNSFSEPTTAPEGNTWLYLPGGVLVVVMRYVAVRMGSAGLQWRIVELETGI